MNALRRLTLSLDSLTRGFAVLLSGSVARLALGFVAGVLTARALGPAAFGVYATLGAAANIVGAIADFGLSEAGVRRVAAVWNDDPTTARERAWVFFRLRVGVAAGVVGVGLLFIIFNSDILSAWILNDANSSNADETLVLGSQFSVLGALALVGVLATALSGAVSAMLQATGAYGRLSLVLIVNSALTATLAVALTLLGWLNLVTALAVLGIGTSLVSFALGLRLLPFAERRTTNDGRRTTNDQRRPTNDGRRMTNDDRCTTHHAPRTTQDVTRTTQDVTRKTSESRALLRFGRWLWMANMLAMTAAYLDLLLLNHWLTPSLVGIYALAVNLASKADVINQSLHAVLLPTASALHNEEAVRQYLRQGLMRNGLLSLALLPLFPLADPLITGIYGLEYAASVPLFQMLLGVVVFDIVAKPALLLPFTFDQPKLLAAADAARVATLAAITTWMLPLFGPLGAVIARFAARLLGAAVVVGALVVQSRGERVIRKS
jgi:O-antigen/teichoic acid export membrane protein